VKEDGKDSLNDSVTVVSNANANITFKDLIDHVTAIETNYNNLESIFNE